jgi:hypothetical protein
MPTDTWRRLGVVDPRALAEARLMLHHAAQIATAPGRSLLPARPDDGQTALEWLEEPQALAGEWIAGRDRWRPALCPADLALLMLGDSSGAATFPLTGRTLDDGVTWLRAQASRRGSDGSRLSLSIPYTIPAHAVGVGGRFPPEPDPDFAELARYISNTDRLLRAFVAGRPEVSAVRCWPHHFDIGAVITLDDSRTVGLGLSPGDEAIAEPYWYVNTWPRPESLPEPMPRLPGGGRWNVEGWLGAVLTGSALVAAGDGEAQEALARQFLDVATTAARVLLA